MKTLLAALLLFSASPAEAKDEVAVRSIAVVGEAEMKFAPDEAGVSINVQSENLDLKKAKADNDDKQRRLLEIVRKLGIEKEDVKTNYASIYPNYLYNNNQRQFVAYVVSTNLEITVKDIEKVGPLTQSLVDAQNDLVNSKNQRTQALEGDVLARQAPFVPDDAGHLARAERRNHHAAGRRAHSIGQPVIQRAERGIQDKQANTVHRGVIWRAA